MCVRWARVFDETRRRTKQAVDLLILDKDASQTPGFERFHRRWCSIGHSGIVQAKFA